MSSDKPVSKLIHSTFENNLMQLLGYECYALRRKISYSHVHTKNQHLMSQERSIDSLTLNFDPKLGFMVFPFIYSLLGIIFSKVGFLISCSIFLSHRQNFDISIKKNMCRLLTNLQG